MTVVLEEPREVLNSDCKSLLGMTEVFAKHLPPAHDQIFKNSEVCLMFNSALFLIFRTSLSKQELAQQI